MATFKAGQRVRILETPENPWTDEGTIIGTDRWHPYRNMPGWEVCADNHPSNAPSTNWCVAECDLRPLTDPGADAFVERLKKLAREPQLVPVTTEHGTALFPK